MFKIMVTASRGWTNRRRIEDVLVRLKTDLNRADTYRGRVEHVVFMHGGANGGDKIAAYVATELGWEVVEFPADWKRHKKKAGVLRSLQMLDQRPDQVVAFWDGSSPGTQHAFEEAIRRGIPTDIYVRRGRP